MQGYVFAVDPGLTTGISVVAVDGGEAVQLAVLQVSHRDFGFLAELVIPTLRPHVVVEDFIITASTSAKTQAPWSLKQLGVAEYLAAKYDCPFVTQPPSAAKAFVSNDKLRGLGWYARGQDHGRDAQRHAVLYLVRHGWWDDALKGT